jgi:hypothetical protein
MKAHDSNQMIDKQELSDAQSAPVETVQSQAILPKWPRLKVEKRENRQVLTPDHPDPAAATAQLMKALGTDDTKFFAEFIKQLGYSGIDREIDVDQLNFKVAFIIGQEPKSQLEAMVLAQMANIYLSAMRLSADLWSLEEIGEIDVTERIGGRLMRTFANQMDALTRYRAGGQRPIHMQTVVGNVTQNQIVHDTTLGKSADASLSALTDLKAAHRRKHTARRNSGAD